MLTRWLDTLKARFLSPRGRSRQSRPAPARTRIQVEALEDRLAPAALDTCGVFDPTTATHYLRDSNTPGAPDVQPFAFGGAGWTVKVGDWNGDGRTTIGVVDPTGAGSDGALVWYLRNANDAGAPDVAPFRYGSAGQIPVVGDWDGDGTDTVGVFDPITATWQLRNSNSEGAPDVAPFRYGGAGWVPVVGDWDGDGKDTAGVFDPATATFYLRNSNSAGAPDVAPFAFGGAGWTPVAGDWNGDGRDSVAVYDLSGVWYLGNSNTAGAPDVTPFAYGGPNMTPVVGAWTFTAPPPQTVSVEPSPTLSPGNVLGSSTTSATTPSTTGATTPSTTSATTPSTATSTSAGSGFSGGTLKVEFSNGFLYIEGTGSSETITVRESGGNISVDGVSGRVKASQVRLIGVNALGGNDWVDLPGVRIPSLVSGGAGKDTLGGGADTDILGGGDGADKIYGGGGSDLLLGQGGNDELQGEAGIDILIGGDGDDRLFGDAGDDLLLGEYGSDILDGGRAGADYLDGESGWDEYYMNGWASKPWWEVEPVSWYSWTPTSTSNTATQQFMNSLPLMSDTINSQLGNMGISLKGYGLSFLE
ncbi:MAG: hypothetical protein IT429_12630 [Gemmataceae bacterium]|nr:hypothetical protein [Gemmataceae bacterium]